MVILGFFRAGEPVFEGWYVNIQDPHHRDLITTYTRDRVVDLVIEPDRTWHRKDVDELRLAIDQGQYTQPPRVSPGANHSP